MRGVRAVILCLLAALVLPGCLRGAAPDAVVQPQSALDAIGFSPRAPRDRVTLTPSANSGSSRVVVPLGTSVRPGDTILVTERWS